MRQNANDKWLDSLGPDKFISWMDDDGNVIKYTKISKDSDPDEILHRINAVAKIHPIHPEDERVTKFCVVSKYDYENYYRPLTGMEKLIR